MSDHFLPSHYDSLEGSLAEAWRLWARGVADRRSPFHAPTLATIGLDGRPRARVVILRGCEPAHARLRFHTDLRSDKVSELAARPAVALTGYDAAAKVQVRLEGEARLHKDDAVADAAWAGSRSFSRACYAIAPGPGTVIGAGGDFTLPVDETEISAGRPHFCAVIVHARVLEWLYLAHGGHRRARFDLVTGAATWLTP